MPLLIHIVKLVGQQEQVAEELDSKVRIAICDFAVRAQKTVKRELNLVPAFAGLVQRVHNRETVEGVVLQVSLAHLLVRLASQGHEVAELSVLLEHQMLVSGLFEAHGLEDSLVCQLICQTREKEGCMLVLSKPLKQLSHLQAETNQALARALLGSLSLGIHVIDSICRGN